MYGTITTNGTGTQWYDLGTTSGYIDPWPSWNRTQTFAITTTHNVWVNWTTSSSTTNLLTFTGSGYAPAQVVPVNPVLLNAPEEHWNDLRARNEAARLDREADATRVAARVEASKLLALVLTKAQMADYAANKHFDVVGSEGGIYRISHGTSGNIRQLVDGKIVNRLCVHPQLRDDSGGYLPTEDCLAAQALALMHDERGAVNRANVHAGVRHLRAA